MSQECFYDSTFVMKKGFPKVTKLGAVSPYGECSPFVFNGRAYRMELVDTSHGLDPSHPNHSIIRDRETGEIVSRPNSGRRYGRVSSPATPTWTCATGTERR